MQNKRSASPVPAPATLMIVICLIIGILLTVWGISGKISVSRRTADYESVIGHYIGYEVYSEGREGRDRETSTYALVYEYEVAGETYTRKTDYGTGVIPEIGSEREVLYDPADPSVSVLAGSSSHTALIFGGVLFIVVPLVFIMFSLAANGRFAAASIDIAGVTVGAALFICGAAALFCFFGYPNIISGIGSGGIAAIITLVLTLIGAAVLVRALVSRRSNTGEDLED